ncbi:MAG: glycosyltransferase family 4 protein [Bacteroidales bacterium]|jgi:glycosyltransferase involved in cell wall biosynthesis|nr:glycosyltransferase family 4 protein [Bacteroidales bacterium]
MPKVLRIINRFNLGGPTYNVAYLSKYLSPDYDTLLVGGMNSKDEACSDYIIKKLGIHAITIPEMTREIGYNDLIAYKKIENIVKRYKPDIVHTHASKAGYLGRKAAIKLKVPVIVHTFHGHIFHSYFNKYTTSIFKKLEQNLANKTDVIIAISPLQKEELSKVHKIANEEKFRVIPLGFDLNRFQENLKEKRQAFRLKYDLKDDEIVISSIGRLVAVKNHPLFIKAFAKAKNKTTKKVKAMIVGDGFLRNGLVELAWSLGLKVSVPEKSVTNPDIIFTSWIGEADMVFAGSEIAALSSFNEGTPVSLIEAQASNTPIISTNVGGVKDIVIEGKTGLLCENDNVDDYSEKLLTLIENTKLREDMSQNGWDFVKNKFHYTRLVNDVKSLYDELLGKL